MSTDRLTHLVSANAENMACEAAELPIKTSTRLEFCWKLLKYSGEKSMVAVLKLYSDKSLRKLRKRVFVLYVLRFAIWNLEKERVRAHFKRGHRNMAHIPVRKNS